MQFGQILLRDESRTLEICDDNNGSNAEIHPRRDSEGPKGEEMYNTTLSLTLMLDGRRLLKPRPDCFTSGNYSVLTVQEAG
jgi:hypothetical protein